MILLAAVGSSPAHAEPGAKPQADHIPVVRIEEAAEGYRLLRDGEPFWIRGAGGVDHLARLRAAGGNSVRTWGTDQTEQVLDRAHELGLTVLAGIWIEHERHGFDYGDEEAVAAQIARHRADVDRFKDHPAILMWGVGNEVSIDSTDPRVWDTIEAVAAYIKKEDTARPVMTVLPHVSAGEIELVRERCPSIDLLGFNTYRGIDSIAADARRAGWEGPYIIAEWGPDGAWEADETPWGAEIEPTTSAKAAQRGLRYTRILREPACLGSYVFYWGQKQETTPTWFNLFLENDAALECVEVMQYLWTGQFPAHRAPAIGPLRLEGQGPESGLIVAPGASLQAEFCLLRGDLEAMDVRWELLPESQHKGIGGDLEERPAPVALRTETAHPSSLHFRAPTAPGPYRLFVYVENAHRQAASANFPFLVE
ncbi:MAG: glycoside hydrolase family 2 TIM barrel-domain containing protein [Verrucomicrobiota bacterium]